MQADSPRRSSPSARPLLALAAAGMAAIALAACTPPPELDRAATPPDARASDLLPPGPAGDARDLLAGARDQAMMRRTDNERMAAFRFATPGEALARFSASERLVAACRGASARSTMRYGDAAYVRCTRPGASGLAWTSGTWLYLAEATDDERLARMIGASRAGGLGTGLPSSLWTVFALAAAGTLLAVLAATWAAMTLALRLAAVRPAPGVAPVARAELVARLLALNGPGLPFSLRLEPAGELVAEWKYADAAWWGIMAKSGVHRSYRQRLRFDERPHAVKARDEFGDVEWSAGALVAPTIRYRRSFFRGVALFRYQRGVAYGFRGPTGRGPHKVLDYKFTVAELKDPIVEIVVAAGWRFEPALW